MPTDYPSLVPRGVAAEVIASVTDEQSALMKLAQVIRMPSGAEQVPVVSSAPVSGFVSPAYGGLKPGSSVDWEALTLTAGEIGVLVAIPDAYLSDSSYDVWGSVKGEVTRSFVGVFERAALYGTNAPTDWPAGGLTAAAHADAVSGADALAALDAAMSTLEANGVPVDGILGGAALHAALRQQTVASLQPFSPEPSSLWGVPLAYSSHWDDAVGLALVGGFASGVLVGVREDITFTISSEGVITDATGKVILNALQSDSSILRSYMRVALQAAQPLGPDGTPVKTLALAKVGAAAGRAKAA